MREEDKWWCVTDDNYMGWWLDNKNSTPEHKEEYIKNNGIEYIINKDGNYVRQD